MPCVIPLTRGYPPCLSSSGATFRLLPIGIGPLYCATVPAEEAVQIGRYPLARSLLEGLPAKPEVQKHRQRLLKLMEPPGPKSAMEAAITVERLREEGMIEEAERRLADALRRWPGDEELARLA